LTASEKPTSGRPPAAPSCGGGAIDFHGGQSCRMFGFSGMLVRSSKMKGTLRLRE
jgi:hypothetical protein